MAMERPDQSNTRVSVVGSAVSIGPAQASAAPVAPGVNAFDGTRTKKFKSAREAERAAKRDARREARRQKALEDEIRSARRVPDEVVGTVRAMPSEARGQPAEERSTRRSRNAVPDEVIAAVEEATRGRGRRGQEVTVGSPSGDERIYYVPRGRY
jgi:hypothetical protein